MFYHTHKAKHYIMVYLQLKHSDNGSLVRTQQSGSIGCLLLKNLFLKETVSISKSKYYDNDTQCLLTVSTQDLKVLHINI